MSEDAQRRRRSTLRATTDRGLIDSSTCNRADQEEWIGAKRRAVDFESYRFDQLPTYPCPLPGPGAHGHIPTLEAQYRQAKEDHS